MSRPSVPATHPGTLGEDRGERGPQTAGQVRSPLGPVRARAHDRAGARLEVADGDAHAGQRGPAGRRDPGVVVEPVGPLHRLQELDAQTAGEVVVAEARPCQVTCLAWSAVGRRGRRRAQVPQLFQSGGDGVVGQRVEPLPSPRGSHRTRPASTRTDRCSLAVAADTPAAAAASPAGRRDPSISRSTNVDRAGAASARPITEKSLPTRRRCLRHTSARPNCSRPTVRP